MCGRYTLRVSASDVARALGAVAGVDWAPRYNIAPTQQVPVARQLAGAPRQLTFMRWGLVPSWADSLAVGSRMINARGETLATKPAFRQAFCERRCVIPCDGFYEWRSIAGRKQPFHITLADGGLFALAGLWETWRGAEQPVESCTIVTTAANARLTEFHDRMPVIIPPESLDLWLDPLVRDAKLLEPLLRSYPSDEMRVTPASPVVNNVRNDSAACLGEGQREFDW